MNDIAGTLCASVAVVLCAVTGAFGSTSTNALICVNPAASLQWKTVTAALSNVALDWPTGAVSAVVSVDGEAVATSSDVTSDSVSVTFSLPNDATGERIITITVSYQDAEGIEVSAASASLGLVAGTKSGDAVCVKDEARRGHWSRASVRRPVVLLPESVSNVTFGGEALYPVMNAPGWQTLALSGGGDLLTAIVDGKPFSMSVGVRRAFMITVK